MYNVQDNGEVQQYMAPREVLAKASVEGAVILDDYAGSERIFFLVDEAPTEVSAIKAALQKSYATPLPDLEKLPLKVHSQRSVLIVKAAQP